jgi:hypothetical protein
MMNVSSMLQTCNGSWKKLLVCSLLLDFAAERDIVAAIAFPPTEEAFRYA